MEKFVRMSVLFMLYNPSPAIGSPFVTFRGPIKTLVKLREYFQKQNTTANPSVIMIRYDCLNDIFIFYTLSLQTGQENKKIKVFVRDMNKISSYQIKIKYLGHTYTIRYDFLLSFVP